MRNYVAILAVIVFVLTFLGSETSAGRHRPKRIDEKNKKCPVVVKGPSKDAFKKNLPQDFCNFEKGDGQLKQADGTQIRVGLCSNTPQGQIPRVDKMVSTLILYPTNDDKIKQNKPFTVKVQTENIELGFFSDPIKNYNTFPQKLNKKGLIQGHQHVTIQFLGRDKDNIKFPDPTEISFFKGLNDKSEDGTLSVNADRGLDKKGLYRLCTMVSSFSHQPVIMPIAQRGAQDDCVRFEVV